MLVMRNEVSQDESMMDGILIVSQLAQLPVALAIGQLGICSLPWIAQREAPRDGPLP